MGRRVSTLLLVMALAACSGDGGGTPTDPGGQPTLTLTADAAQLFLGASTQLNALARQSSGAPLSGVSVEFATTLGLLGSTTVATDGQGRASTLLRATETGTAVVTARLSGAPAAELTIQMGQGSVVVVLPASSTMALDGETAISVRVARRDGSPTPSGTALEMSTTLGALSETRPRTDAAGVARTVLRADGRSGRATVRAVLPGTQDAGQAEVQIGAADRLRITAEPAIIAPQGSSRITALLSQASGAPLAGVTVRFASDLGRLDATEAVTDASGAAFTTLRPGGATGLAAVRATASAVSASVAVQVDGGARLRLRANPPAISPSGSTTVSVVASFVDGTPLPTGTSIDLTTTLGRLDAGRLTTAADGTAATVLRGDGRRGTARVSATAAGYSGAGAIEVTIR